MNPSRKLAILLAAAALMLGGGASAAQKKSTWLITPDEAKLESAKPERLVPMVRMRGLPTGPKIVVQSPKSLGEVKAPLPIDVRFEPAADDAKVDVASVKVIYVRMFDIDITDRVRPYLSASGIRHPDAKLPGGRHVIEISVKDTKGHTTTERMSFTVKEE